MKDIEVAPDIFQSEEDYQGNMDYDALKDAQAEEAVYRKWEREQKNHILSINDHTRKQEEWNSLFPKLEKGDDWMLGNVF